MMLGRRPLGVTLLFGAWPVFAQAKPKVVATFSILGDLVGEVGADTDAHTYQPKPTDARTLAVAQALVSNGLGFEGWMDRLAKAAPFTGRAIVATSGVAILEVAPSPGRGHTHGPDPHCWQDVGRTRRYVANIAEGLVAADAANAAYYRERAQSYDTRLARLDQWVKAEIAK